VQLIDDLRREHELIERVALSLLTFAKSPNDVDAALFVRFFRTYAGSWHHEREEELLTPALEAEASLPADRGPIAVLLADHAAMSAMLDDLADADTAARYAHALLQHIDVENSVFFPESERRLRNELASRSETEEELEARAIGEDLIRLYPPSIAADVVRGDGCVICPAYGDTCRGLEAEWWNEWEWETVGEGAD
jgi:hemerythrin-like domain-containing protein